MSEKLPAEFTVKVRGVWIMLRRDSEHFQVMEYTGTSYYRQEDALKHLALVKSGAKLP